MFFLYLSTLGSYMLMCFLAAVFYHRKGYSGASWIFVFGMLLTPIVAFLYVFSKPRKFDKNADPMPTGNAAAFQQLHRNQTEEWPSQTAQGKQTGNDALINQLTEKRGLKAEE